MVSLVNLKRKICFLNRVLPPKDQPFFQVTLKKSWFLQGSRCINPKNSTLERETKEII